FFITYSTNMRSGMQVRLRKVFRHSVRSIHPDIPTRHPIYPPQSAKLVTWDSRHFAMVASVEEVVGMDISSKHPCRRQGEVGVPAAFGSRSYYPIARKI
ncbi:hypothetical protein EMPG_15899, partial [Blastomyces silverae]